MIGIGHIVLSIFFFINDLLKDNKLITKQFDIIKSHDEGKNSPASVEIKIDGIIKEIGLPGNTIKQIDHSDKIKISYRIGGLGFWIVEEKRLVR
jgi:hypothetical protein